MASSSTPNHDFAPAWLRLPASSQRPSGDSLTHASYSSSSSSSRRDEGPFSSLSATKSKSLSQEQRRDRGRAAFAFRHHSIDADDLQQHRSSGGGQGNGTFGGGSNNGDHRLHPGQRQHSGSQPSLGGVRRPLSRQDFREGSKGFGGLGGGGENYRSGGDVHWGRQRSFDRAGRSGGRSGGGSSDLSGGGSVGPSRGGGGGGAAKWKDDHIDKFDKEFPSLRIGGPSTVPEPLPSVAASVNNVWDKSKSGKIHLSSSSVGKKLHLVQKPIRNDVSVTKRSSSPTTGSGISTAGRLSPKSSTQTLLKQTGAVNNNGSTSVYRTLGSTKGPMLRRPSKDIGKSSGLPIKTVPQQPPPPASSIPPSPPAEVLNSCLVTHPKSLLLAANKNDFLRELRDDGGSGTPEATSPPARTPSNHDEDPEERFGSDADVVTKGWCNGHYGESSDSDEDDAEPVLTSTPTAGGQLPLVNGMNSKGETNEEELPREQQHPAVNGISIRGSSLDKERRDSEILSRSLEAEQRLLREMGWKEEGSEDEGVYAPLTEDEMSDFKKSMSNKIPKRNGFQRNVQFTWSPKHMLVAPKVVCLESEISSTSTSSDSDD